MSDRNLVGTRPLRPVPAGRSRRGSGDSIRRFLALALLPVTLGAAVGCGTLCESCWGPPTPARVGLNTRDLIDPTAQSEADRLLNVGSLVEVGSEVKQLIQDRAARTDPTRTVRPQRNVLCLSGGGSYGAFSAGLLVGWTAAGTRPEFDTVTGISTGALIAPLAFLGPKYDAEMKRFYTDIRTRDVYSKRTVRGLISIALADNAPLAEKIGSVLTEELIVELASEHRKGRRLYVGTTELESKRFVVWDLGAIACREGYAGKELLTRVLLASAAIPGFFPPTSIPVTVDGRCLVEKHGDGGVSAGIFFRPPYSPPDAHLGPAPLAGTQVWCVIAGKLYADPAPLERWSLGIAGTSVSAVIYSQTRGDLMRIYTGCILGGMDYHLTAIPAGFPAPKSSTEFDSGPMTRMFDEGYRLALSGRAWRSTAPGAEPGETVRERDGTILTVQQRGPTVDTTRPETGGTPGPLPIPAVPGATQK